MDYSILQLSSDPQNADRRFRSFAESVDRGDTVHPSNYCNVFTGTLPERIRDLPEKEILNYLYSVFNSSQPQGFKGHSMSVSDVIILRYDDEPKAFYVDSLGFIRLTSEQWQAPENYLRAAELSMEGNDNMIDGIINNLPTDTQEPHRDDKDSLLSQLNRERSIDTAAIEERRKTARSTEEVR